MNMKVSVSNVVLQESAINTTLSNVIFGVAMLNVKNVSSGIRLQDSCMFWKDLGKIRFFYLMNSLMNYIL